MQFCERYTQTNIKKRSFLLKLQGDHYLPSYIDVIKHWWQYEFLARQPTLQDQDFCGTNFRNEFRRQDHQILRSEKKILKIQTK